MRSNGGHTFTASMRVPTAWSTTALPLGVGVDTTVGSAPGLASKVTEWAGRAATNEAASNVALAAFNAPASIQHDQGCILSYYETLLEYDYCYRTGAGAGGVDEMESRNNCLLCFG